MLPRHLPVSAGLLSLALVSATVHFAAQSALSIQPQNCVGLQGDNRTWAAPSLNESSWQPYSNWTIETGLTRIWVRFHPDLRNLLNLADPAIQVTLYDAYELHLNGVLVGKTGNLARGDFDLNAIRSFPVNSEALLAPVAVAHA